MANDQYIKELLRNRVRIFHIKFGDKFRYMDNNVTCNRPAVVQDFFTMRIFNALSGYKLPRTQFLLKIVWVPQIYMFLLDNIIQQRRLPSKNWKCSSKTRSSSSCTKWLTVRHVVIFYHTSWQPYFTYLIGILSVRNLHSFYNYNVKAIFFPTNS